MPDPIQMLKHDHERLRGMFARLGNVAMDQRQRLLDEIERDLKIHAQLEEEIFYPAFRDAAAPGRETQMFYEATEEHYAVDALLPDLKAVSDEGDRFAARAKVIRELIEHHIVEEEGEMLPRAEQILSTRLDELGRRMTERKLELEKEWKHPLGRVAHKVKSAADKILPTSLKESHEDEGRRPR